MSTRILAGRYELLERIGSGGMAVVYKARCRLLNRFVAIKILKPDFIKDVKFIENFRRESQAAASLNHPNIVNVYDVGREGNIHYIVMEYIEGEPLSEIIARNGALDYARVIEISKQISLALSAAHSHHIIHRDVKPHNILITNDGVAKITDFGIAKAVNAATLVGNTGTVMGSVHYFSPEQARGGFVDEKSDIYSFGIVMYEMLTGHVPFDGENPVSVALKHINEEIIPPSRLVAQVPPRLEQIIMKATDKFQINRYKSAEEMYEALNNFEFVQSIVGNRASNGLGDTSGFNARRKTRENRRLDLWDKTEPEQELEREVFEDTAGERSVQDESSRFSRKNNKTNKKGKNKKVKDAESKRVFRKRVLIVIIALLCAIPTSYFIVSALDAYNAKTIIVPNITGMDYEEAEKVLKKLHLRIEKGDEVLSEYDEGIVVTQTPNPDSKVKRNKIIVVDISKGLKEGTVPNLLGMSKENAIKSLTRYGYKVGDIRYEDGEGDKDTVLKQTPEPGDEAINGSFIALVLCSGNAGEVKMPFLIGQNLDKAKKELAEAGLKVGEITFGTSSAYSDGEVMWQSVDADQKIAKGSSVNLKVVGKDASVTNKTVPIAISYEHANNQVFYLTVTVTDASGTRTIISNQQRIKDSGGETVNVAGIGKGSVTVIMDGNVVMKKNVNFDAGE